MPEGVFEGYRCAVSGQCQGAFDGAGGGGGGGLRDHVGIASVLRAVAPVHLARVRRGGRGVIEVFRGVGIVGVTGPAVGVEGSGGFIAGGFFGLALGFRAANRSALASAVARA